MVHDSQNLEIESQELAQSAADEAVDLWNTLIDSYDEPFHALLVLMYAVVLGARSMGMPMPDLIVGLRCINDDISTSEETLQ